MHRKLLVKMAIKWQKNGKNAYNFALNNGVSCKYTCFSVKNIDLEMKNDEK